MALSVTNSGTASVTFSTALTIPFTPTAGRLLILVLGFRNQGTIINATGWTDLINEANSSAGIGGCYIFGKVSDGTETTFPGVASGGAGDYSAGVFLEIAGATLAGYTKGAGTGYVEDSFISGSPRNAPTITPTSGVEAILISGGDSKFSGGCGVASGWTRVGYAGGGDYPVVDVGYKIVNPTSGSYTPQFTNGGNNVISMASLALYVGDVAVASAPAQATATAMAPEGGNIGVEAGNALATATSPQAGMGANAEVAQATTTALVPTVSQDLRANAEVAGATASAEDPTTDNVGGTAHPFVGVASVTATANAPIAGGVVAGVAQATATALDTQTPSVSASPTAGVAQAVARALRPLRQLIQGTLGGGPDGLDVIGVSPIRLEINHEEILGMEWGMTTQEVLGDKDSAQLWVQDRDNSWEPQAHWDVRVVVRSTGWVLFRGEIASMPVEFGLHHPWRTWKLECVGYFDEYPQRLVGAFDGKTWRDTSGLGIYVNIDPNAQSLETDRLTVQNLHDVYIRVDGNLPIETERYVGEYLTDFFPISWDYSHLKQALEELAALIAANLQFWLDPDLFFHWVTIPAWQDLGTSEPNIPYMDLAPAQISDVTEEEDEIGFSRLRFNLDGSEMPEQVYVRGGTGYVYNQPPVPPNETTQTVVRTPVAGATATYEITILTPTKIWHTDGSGFISLSYDIAPAGGPYNAKWTRVPWNAARNKGGNFWKLLDGPYAGKLLDNDTNVLGYGRIRVVATTVTPGDPDDPKIGIGGSGFVGEVDQDKSKRQAYLNAPVSTTKEIRDSLGGQSIYRGATPTLRASVDVYGIDGWRVGQLVKLTDARLPSYMNERWFVIQRVRATLIPANDLRRYTIDFGDGPTSRYSAQGRGGDVAWPPPAIKIDISVHDLSPGPNSTQIITGQLVNGSGQPWAISGKTVNWSFECYNAAGVLQTDQGSIDPEVSVTDKEGRARIKFTSGPGTGLVYYIFARVKAV